MFVKMLTTQSLTKLVTKQAAKTVTKRTAIEIPTEFMLLRCCKCSY